MKPTNITCTLVLIASAMPVFAADGDAPSSTPPVSVLQMFMHGGIFMYPLALCSVAAVSLILDRALALRRKLVIPHGFVAGLRSAFHDRDSDARSGLDYCAKQNCTIARIVAAGLRRHRHGWTAVEKAMEDAGATEAIRLRRNMRLLYAMGSVATLLGLIGTISGMIKAFQVASVAGVGRVDQLSRGIYEAMTCTFAGLAVAIVVTSAYYFFAGRIERLIADMNDEMSRFADEYGYEAAHVAKLTTSAAA